MKALLVLGLVLISSVSFAQRAFENVRQKVEIIGPTSAPFVPVRPDPATFLKKETPSKVNDVTRKR